MLSRRDFLQVALVRPRLSTGLGGGMARSPPSRGLRRRICCASTQGPADAPAHDRLPWPVDAASISASRRSISASAMNGLPPHLTGAEYLKHFGIPAGIAPGLCASRTRTYCAGQNLRPRRRHGPHGDADQGHPRRARRRPPAAARRRRYAAWLLHGDAVGGRRYGPGARCAGLRGDHRSLGVHARRRPAWPSCLATRTRPGKRQGGVPRRQHPRHRFRGTGLHSRPRCSRKPASKSPSSARRSRSRRSPTRAG